jgi:glycine/D-amino acid oxidase-like deaminating enzyme
MTHGNSLRRIVDIVILGAGVMGASIAFHLAQGKPRQNR